MTSGECKIDWVVFDLGGVVLAKTSRLPDLAAYLNIEVEALAGGYSQHRLDYDRDSDHEAFWTGATDGTGISAPTGDFLAELVELDEVGCSTVIPETLRLIEDLHAGGYGLAVCSNAPSSMGVRVRRQDWAAPFERFVFSGDIGVVKPAPEIFAAVVAATGASPERTVFFDDLIVNVEGARAAGWHAFLFTDAATARKDLAELGVLAGSA